MFLNFFILGFVCLAGVEALQREDVVVSEQFLSPEWENFDCHSSSIIETKNGEILAVWKGGFGAGQCNIDLKSQVGIWQARFNGKQWSVPQRIHFEEKSVVWNPVLGKLPSGEFLLFYRVGSEPVVSVAFLKRSKDEGDHWGEAAFLPAGIVGPAKNKPLVLEDGTILCPSSAQAGSADEIYQATAAWIDISTDEGKTWSKSGPLTIPGRPFGVIEPSLFFDAEGNLRLLCRDRQRRLGGVDGSIWTAISLDQGRTWSALEKTELPNPDSAFDVADLGKGNLVLFYNHSSTERFPLSIAISKDGGKTWERKCDLEEISGEFPAVIYTSDGLIHTTYAYDVGTGQRKVKHVVINPEKLFGTNP